MHDQTLSVAVASATLMQALGASLSDVLRAGDVLALNGDLGAGKTCLVQGLAGGLGVTEPVTSPTFVLMRQYDGRIPLVHVDVYRLSALSDINDLGDDVLADDCVTAIEWGQAVRPLLGENYLHIDIALVPTNDTPEQRVVTLVAHGPSWVDRRAALASVMAAYPTP
jgi:tRNA threonylcarbamoyladenosine biosynthesis protein TsaE